MRRDSLPKPTRLCCQREAKDGVDQLVRARVFCFFLLLFLFLFVRLGVFFLFRLDDAVEAMSMKLPVIATFWSGMTAYMTDDNSFPVAVESVDAIVDGPFAGLRWATPSLASLRAAMRRVVDDRDEAQRRGERARQLMVERYCPDCVARLIDERVRGIAAKTWPDKTRAEQDEL